MTHDLRQALVAERDRINAALLLDRQLERCLAEILSKLDQCQNARASAMGQIDRLLGQCNYLDTVEKAAAHGASQITFPSAGRLAEQYQRPARQDGHVTLPMKSVTTPAVPAAAPSRPNPKVPTRKDAAS